MSESEANPVAHTLAWAAGLTAIGVLLPLLAAGLHGSGVLVLEKLGLAFGVLAYIGSFFLIGLGVLLALGVFGVWIWRKAIG